MLAEGHDILVIDDNSERKAKTTSKKFEKANRSRWKQTGNFSLLKLTELQPLHQQVAQKHVFRARLRSCFGSPHLRARPSCAANPGALRKCIKSFFFTLSAAFLPALESSLSKEIYIFLGRTLNKKFRMELFTFKPKLTIVFLIPQSHSLSISPIPSTNITSLLSIRYFKLKNAG